MEGEFLEVCWGNVAELRRTQRISRNGCVANSCGRGAPGVHLVHPRWALRSETEDRVDELALPDGIALCYPADLTSTDCTHRLVATNPLIQNGCIPLDPTPDGDMVDGQAALRHDLLEIEVRQGIS